MEARNEGRASGAASASVGRGLGRVDGAAKVSGSARYVDDIQIEGMLFGATKRSDIAHGKLVAIRKSPDFDWSDVTVVVSDDIAGANTILLMEEDQPALAPIGGMIRHKEEAIALVAAPSRAKARAALAHLLVEAEEVPAVFDPEEALTAKVKVYGEDNLLKSFLIEKGEGVEEALQACHYVVEGEYRTQAQEQMYIEPQGMIASWDDAGVCRIVGSMQCPFYIQKALRRLLDLDDAHLVVEQAVTGGGFGGKEEYPSMIAGHAALLAKKAGRPVKLIYERDEDIAATTKRHPSIVRHRIGFDENAQIQAMDVDVIFDGGAYLTLTPVVLSRGVLHAAGPYKCAKTRVRGRAVATNTAPFGAFRGFGAPQTTFAYERQIQKAAQHFGISPVEIRERNMLRLGDTTSTSQRLEESVGSEAVMSAIKEHAASAPLAESSDRIRRGRGISFYFHGAGFTGSGEARLAGRATIALTPTGTFEVRSSSTDIGQGVQTMFTQIAAQALGVAESAVRVPDPATDRVPDSGPTVASRTCMVVGKVVGEAGTKLRARIDAWAEEQGLSDMPFLDAAAAMARVEGEVTETVQYSPPPGIVWDDDTYTGSAYPCYGWAACLVDVSVDVDTYEVRIDRCVHAVDVGKAINPVIVKGQIEGGTLQSLGWALWEDVIYRDGRVANDRMTNCIVPTFSDAPEMTTIIVEEPFSFGPHGAKGVGEIPMDGPCAAVAGALQDAFADADPRSFDCLPLSPESISKAMRSRS